MSETAQDKESDSSNSPGVKETPAGVKFEGKWDDLVKFSDQFTKELKQDCQKTKLEEDKNIDGELTKWESWRPQETENKTKNKKNLNLETAKQARFKSKIPPNENFKKSSTDFQASQRKLEEGNPRLAFTFFFAGLWKLGKGLINLLGNGLGKLEEVVYRYITNRTNPYYFDTQLISARLSKIITLPKDGANRYQLTIKVHNRSIHRRICRRIK